MNLGDEWMILDVIDGNYVNVVLCLLNYDGKVCYICLFVICFI